MESDGTKRVGGAEGLLLLGRGGEALGESGSRSLTRELE